MQNLFFSKGIKSLHELGKLSDLMLFKDGIHFLTCTTTFRTTTNPAGHLPTNTKTRGRREPDLPARPETKQGRQDSGDKRTANNLAYAVKRTWIGRAKVICLSFRNKS